MQGFDGTLTSIDISAVRKRFEILNRERLSRAQLFLRERQRDFLDVLPLVFHTNHPSLPGFVSKSTPAGVAEYRPTDRSLIAAKRFSKSFSQKRRALPRYEILALYLMGSSGTVAYSKKSDFDIWICHREDLDFQQLDELRQKAFAIELWAAELDLEVHFFLVEPNAFARGVHEMMSAESSGSAQHFLLMEEFYRTGLLLAGRYPLWWIIPPIYEQRYDECRQLLLQRRLVSESEFIDFGAIPGVPAEEFFGAALWQLYKSIDSPYKSVLKLLLMEVYASEYPAIELLCHRFKKAIYAGESSLDQLDPYLMVYRKIDEYLTARDEQERLDLLRRCFYFKVNDPLSVPDRNREDNWRRQLMLEVTGSWGWNQPYLEMLDTRSKWKIDRVMRERQVLVKALTFSYQFLSDFARKHAQLAAINQRDLNILGRKLYAAFERKSGKVEIINRGISSNLWESHLTFVHSLSADNSETWLLFAMPLNLKELRQARPLRRSLSLIELLAWCHFNNMLDSSTAVALHNSENNVTPRELKEISTSLQKLFPVEAALKTEIDNFAQPQRAAEVVVFINLGVDPMADAQHHGRFTMSDKTDALNYGGLGENLALIFDMIVVTSWKEVLTSRYVGITGLLDCIRDYLRWAPVSGVAPPPPISALCFSYARAVTIRQRMEELFADIVSCFYAGKNGLTTRYVLAIEQMFYVLELREGVLSYEKASSHNDLTRVLGALHSSYHPVVFDRYAMVNGVLPLIYSVGRENLIQAFFVAVGEDTDVYIVDEMGSLVYQRLPSSERGVVFEHFARFFDAITHRNMFGREPNGAAEQIQLEFYELIQSPYDKRYFLMRREPLRLTAGSGGLDIQVIGSANEGNQSAVTIYCDEHEFSTMEFGINVYREVAKFVLQRRKKRQRYPIYITDLDLPAIMVGKESGRGGIQTAVLLNYKRSIEKQLSNAIDEQILLDEQQDATPS